MYTVGSYAGPGLTVRRVRSVLLPNPNATRGPAGLPATSYAAGPGDRRPTRLASAWDATFGADVFNVVLGADRHSDTGLRHNPDSDSYCPGPTWTCLSGDAGRRTPAGSASSTYFQSARVDVPNTGG